MTPYLNEEYPENHTKSDMVLVSMMPSRVWPWEQTRRLERGMVVTFRYVSCLSERLGCLKFKDIQIGNIR
jgi:hypothetical protein